MTPLATAGELDVHMQKTIDPARAALAVELASGAVRAFCKWDIARETTTLYAEGNRRQIVSLPTMHLEEVTQVRINGVVQVLDPLTLIWTRNGQLMRVAGWPPLSAIEVDCTHGYDPIPDLIKLVVLEHAARAMANPEGLVSVTVGQVSRTYQSGAAASNPRLSDLDRRLLERYAI